VSATPARSSSPRAPSQRRLDALATDGCEKCGLAWACVGLRIAHSLVQSLSNHIPSRFALFTVSTLVLVALTAIAALTLWRLPGT
jgi:hypothetical protein